MGRRHGDLHRHGLPARIIDLLEREVPLTRFQIAAALDADERTVERALYRLRDRELVESFPVKGSAANRWGLI